MVFLVIFPNPVNTAYFSHNDRCIFAFCMLVHIFFFHFFIKI